MVVEKGLCEDVGRCHSPWAAKQIPLVVRNVVGFAGAGPSYVVAEVSENLVSCLIPCPRRRRLRRHPSCP